MKNAPTVAETRNPESSLSPCCSPSTHVVVLQILEADAATDNDLSVILPAARALLRVTSAPERRREDDGAVVPWWAV